MSAIDQFSHYAEPADILNEPDRHVHAGLGDADGVEYAFVGAGGDIGSYGGALLTLDQLGELINTLSEIHGAMQVVL